MTDVRITKEALESQVGEEVPLTLNGQRIGTARAVKVDETGLLLSIEVDNSSLPGLSAIESLDGATARGLSFGFQE